MAQPSPQSYPRSTPYHPPLDLAAQQARLRRWTFLLLGSSAVTVAVLLGAIIYLLTRSSKPTELEKPGNASPRSWVRNLTPVIGTPNERPDSSSTPPESRPDPVKAGEAGVQSIRLLEALGGLTAVNLYQTYLSIGLLADGAESDVYSTPEAKQLMTTLMSFVETMDRQLARVGEQDLKPEDKKLLDRARQIAALYRVQAKELIAYWDTGDKEHTARFHKAREDAWLGLKDLGIVE